MVQERTNDPSTCTEHAPQTPMPQPYLLPVSLSVSLKTHNNGVSESPPKETGLSFTVRSIIATSSNCACISR